MLNKDRNAFEDVYIFIKIKSKLIMNLQLQILMNKLILLKLPHQ